VTGPGSTHLSQTLHIPIIAMDDKQIYIKHRENINGRKKRNEMMPLDING
jgi:hypothetical protein